MPDREYDLRLPVKGELNTALPIGDLPPGTLVAASDVASDSWGVRRADRRFTGIWEGPGTGSLYDGITLGGVDTGARCFSREPQFSNLGTQFTLDLWFQLSETAYAAGKDIIGLYKFFTGNVNRGTLAVYIYGPNHVNAGKLRVELVTNPVLGTADTQVNIVGTTVLVAGTGQVHKYHVRIVRNGASLVLYLNGVSDGSDGTVVATSGLYGETLAGATAAIGRYTVPSVAGTEVSFKGRIFGAILRDGAFDQAPIEAVMPHNAWARNVHHYVLGRTVAFGGSDHYFDAGRFQVHARLDGVSYSLTAAVDNAAPAPCPVQGLKTWTSRSNRTNTSVVAGGILSTGSIA